MTDRSTGAFSPAMVLGTSVAGNVQREYLRNSTDNDRFVLFLACVYTLIACRADGSSEDAELEDYEHGFERRLDTSIDDFLLAEYYLESVWEYSTPAHDTGAPGTVDPISIWKDKTFEDVLGEEGSDAPTGSEHAGNAAESADSGEAIPALGSLEGTRVDEIANRIGLRRAPLRSEETESLEGGTCKGSPAPPEEALEFLAFVSHLFYFTLNGNMTDAVRYLSDEGSSFDSRYLNTRFYRYSKARVLANGTEKEHFRRGVENMREVDAKFSDEKLTAENAPYLARIYLPYVKAVIRAHSHGVMNVRKDVDALIERFQDLPDLIDQEERADEPKLPTSFHLAFGELCAIDEDYETAQKVLDEGLGRAEMGENLSDIAHIERIRALSDRVRSEKRIQEVSSDVTEVEGRLNSIEKTLFAVAGVYGGLFGVLSLTVNFANEFTPLQTGLLLLLPLGVLMLFGGIAIGQLGGVSRSRKEGPRRSLTRYDLSPETIVSAFVSVLGFVLLIGGLLLLWFFNGDPVSSAVDQNSSAGLAETLANRVWPIS